MNAITWLQISELQFSTARIYDTKVVLDELLRDVSEFMQDDGLQPDFIAVTGDIAFSGKAVEYELARQFFDKLLQTTGLDKERLVLIPGNHDVDREQISLGARNIGDSLTDREGVHAILTNAADRRVMFARFEGYAAFVNSYLGEHQAFDDERYFHVRTLELHGSRVALLGLNSAWLSDPDKREGKEVVVGELQVRTALARAEEADLRISLLHHPFDHLREFDRDDVEPMLSDNCDFILHGHEHQTNVLSLSDPDAKAMVIAAGVCEEVGRYPNSYNFVRLDPAAGSGTVYLRRYSDERGGFWTSDTLSYRNVSNGRYVFSFPAIAAPPVPDSLDEAEVPRQEPAPATPPSAPETSTPVPPLTRDVDSPSQGPSSRIPGCGLVLFVLLLLANLALWSFWLWCVLKDQPVLLDFLQTLFTVIGAIAAILAIFLRPDLPFELGGLLNRLGRDPRWLLGTFLVTCLCFAATYWGWRLGWVGSCAPPPTSTLTPTPTYTPSAIPTVTVTMTDTLTVTRSPTLPPTPTGTPTPTRTQTPAPTKTPTPTETAAPTDPPRPTALKPTNTRPAPTPIPPTPTPAPFNTSTFTPTAAPFNTSVP